MDIAHHAAAILVALVLDAVVGDPDRVWRRLAHPIVVMGGAIGWLDRRLNRLELDESIRKRRGVFAIALVALGAAAVGALLALPFHTHWWGFLVEGAIGAILIAQKGLYTHVAAVRDAFAAGGLGAARHAVSMIVGRDPKQLDEDGVARGAIESAAENFADGVVAPAFWGLLFGLPGLFAYKAINTADSMIGHKTERHRAFGWAAARLDDLVNLPASRLSGAIIALAALLTGRDWRASLAAMRRDASGHASPNAGWPETAFAGALGIAIGGPRRYAGVLRDLPFMNATGRKELTRDDISASLKLLRDACVVHGAWVAAIAGAAWALG